MNSEQEQYYLERRRKLQEKEQRNTQKFLQSAFDYVKTQEEIKQDWDDLLKREEEAKKIQETKEEKAEKK